MTKPCIICVAITGSLPRKSNPAGRGEQANRYQKFPRI
jgi:hypothetical protein